MRGQRGFPGTFFTATGLVHQLMEARDERRLIKDPKDAVEYRPVIYTRHAARLIRPQRPNGGPGDVLPLRDEHPKYKSVRRAPIPFSCHGGAAVYSSVDARLLAGGRSSPYISHRLLRSPSTL